MCLKFPIIKRQSNYLQSQHGQGVLTLRQAGANPVRSLVKALTQDQQIVCSVSLTLNHNASCFHIDLANCNDLIRKGRSQTHSFPMSTSYTSPHHPATACQFRSKMLFMEMCDYSLSMCTTSPYPPEKKSGRGPFLSFGRQWQLYTGQYSLRSCSVSTHDHLLM